MMAKLPRARLYDLMHSFLSLFFVLSLFYISTSFSIILLPLYALLVPFHRDLFVKIGNICQNHFLALVVHLLEKWCSLEIKISGELPTNSESSIIIPNHLSHDWPVICALAYHRKSLGNLKIVIKGIVKFVPGFGWSIWLMFWPFVSRKWALDKNILEKLYTNYANQSENTLLCMFCEGTRYSEKAYKASKKFAEENTECPNMEYCLVPRARGFIAATKSFLRSCSEPLSVYNMTLVYEGFSERNPSMIDIIFRRPTGKRSVIIFTSTEKLDNTTIPSDETLKTWLFQRFSEKEALLQDYYDPNSNTDFNAKMQRAGHLSMLTIMPHTLFCLIGSWVATRMYIILFKSAMLLLPF